MKAPRRPVKLKTAHGRAKSDTSRELTVEPPSFVRNEWLETLCRLKADQPKRFAREVSAGLQVTVRNYEDGRQTKHNEKEGKSTAGRSRGRTPGHSYARHTTLPR